MTTVKIASRVSTLESRLGGTTDRADVPPNVGGGGSVAYSDSVFQIPQRDRTAVIAISLDGLHDTIDIAGGRGLAAGQLNMERAGSSPPHQKKEICPPPCCRGSVTGQEGDLTGQKPVGAN
jgi:hypothetical protein